MENKLGLLHASFVDLKADDEIEFAIKTFLSTESKNIKKKISFR